MKPDPLYRLLASAWLYGDWKAETHTERQMQAVMEEAGWWPITEAELLAASEVSTIERAEAGR
jgi:hypothetical protein